METTKKTIAEITGQKVSFENPSPVEGIIPINTEINFVGGTSVSNKAKVCITNEEDTFYNISFEDWNLKAK